MTKSFKNFKKPCFGAMWPFWHFSPKSGQKWIFLEKQGSVSFWIFQLFTIVPKSEKTNMSFLRKMLNWRMDGQTSFKLSWILYHNTRNQFILLISLRDTANFRFLQPKWTLIYEHAHPNIFRSAFNFNEFLSTCKKSGFFIFSFQRCNLFKNPAISLAKNILTRFQTFPIFFQAYSN